MGIFSSIFGKKEATKTGKNVVEEQAQVVETAPSFQKQRPVLSNKRGYADPNGLFPSDLVMLSVAENYKTNATDYPRYLTIEYGIANPYKALQELAANGFLRESTAVETLPSLKVAELKEIAEKLQITCKKQKAPLIEAISAVDEALVAQFIPVRTWKITEAGQTALNFNKYISYFLDRHEYSLSEAGIDIWEVNKYLHNHPKMLYRDVIWRLLNDRENKYSIDLQTQDTNKSYNAHEYSNCYRFMALFLEEEKKYPQAAEFYFQYIFKLINIRAGVSFLNSYEFYLHTKDKKYFNEGLERFYQDCQLYPFQKTDLFRLKEECNWDENAFMDAMQKGFERAGDTGIMSLEQTVDFVIYELNGDTDKSHDLCIKAAKNVSKQIKLKK